MKDLSAADEQRILSADPAANVTEPELARSRSRSLAFMESDVTHIFAGGPESYSRPPARRWRAAGAFLAAAAVAAAVLTANFLQAVPVETPAATESVSPPSPAPTSAPEPTPPRTVPRPLRLRRRSARPGGAAQRGPETRGGARRRTRQRAAGAERRPDPGETAVDVASAEEGTNGSLLWRDSRNEAPFTYLGFFAGAPMAGCI